MAIFLKRKDILWYCIEFDTSQPRTFLFQLFKTIDRKRPNLLTFRRQDEKVMPTVISARYFNVRNFRVQKISRISRMIPQFAKLNGREKKSFGWFAKINSHDTQFSDFLGFFCLLEHKNRLFSLFYPCFCLEKSNFAKINSREMN